MPETQSLAVEMTEMIAATRDTEVIDYDEREGPPTDSQRGGLIDDEGDDNENNDVWGNGSVINGL